VFAFDKRSLAGRGQTLFVDAGFERKVHLFVESVVERIAVFAEGQRTFDGDRGTSKRQSEKIPKMTRIPKPKINIILARLLDPPHLL
jgi:predicted ATPase